MLDYMFSNLYAHINIYQHNSDTSPENGILYCSYQVLNTGQKLIKLLFLSYFRCFPNYFQMFTVTE